MTDLKKLWSDQLPAQDCELEYWFREAENYAEVQIPADDLRAIIARTYAAVNAVPELIALRAERDKAQRACEQMGERITALENLLMLCADQFRVLRRLAEGGQIHRIEAGNKRVRIALSKAVASECEISEAKVRAALNQEPGHE